MTGDQANGSGPILCANLLRRVDDELINLLDSLAPTEWDLQTLAPLWKVRDVAAHLLDTALRKLSMVRDACYVEAINIRSPQDLVVLVNRLNREGVTALSEAQPSRPDRHDESGLQKYASFRISRPLCAGCFRC